MGHKWLHRTAGARITAFDDCHENYYASLQHRNASLKVEEQELRLPKETEVLLRMVLRPINPADISLIQGRMERPPLPLTPGAEGEPRDSLLSLKPKYNSPAIGGPQYD